VTAPRYLAVRFVLPEHDPLSEIPPGLQLSPNGRLSMISGKESVRQALLLLISTRPGERVNRPTYGCDLHRLTFAPADDTTAGLAIQYVRQAVSQWEPRVDIIELDAVPRLDSDPGLDITLSYRLKATSAVDTLAIAMQLEGGGAS
jgi:phage baseplate assembly protein W